MIRAKWATNRWGTKYRYYPCPKKRGRCSQPYVQETDLADKVRARLQTISLCDRYTDWMLTKVREWEREEIGVSQSEVQNLSTQTKADEERMEKLVSTYLDGDVPKEIYLKKKDTLMRSLAALRQKEKDFEARFEREAGIPGVGGKGGASGAAGHAGDAGDLDPYHVCPAASSGAPGKPGRAGKDGQFGERGVVPTTRLPSS